MRAGPAEKEKLYVEGEQRVQKPEETREHVCKMFSAKKAKDVSADLNF